MLRLDDVGHRFGAREALAGVDLTCDTPILGLLGVNGAGKTTLLSIASGALRPTSGRVLVGGADLYHPRERRGALARVALVPDQYQFPPRMTALDFVTYVGWLRGLPERIATPRATYYLERVGLGDRARSTMGELSAGMLKRVGLAQACVAEPDVLLLDEPTAGLDPEQRAAMIGFIGEVVTGRHAVLSSHAIMEIEAVAGGVAVLHDGRIIFDGSVADLRAQALGDVDERLRAEAGFLRLIAAARAGVP